MSMNTTEKGTIKMSLGRCTDGTVRREWACAGIFETQWGRVTHICVDNLTIIGSDNGLSPGRRQAIIWTNVEILLIEPLGTNFIESLIGIITFSIKKMHLKMSSGNWRPFCLGLNELRVIVLHLWLYQNHEPFILVDVDNRGWNVAQWVVLVKNSHDPLSADLVNIHSIGPSIVITAPADVLARRFARPSAVTRLTTKLVVFSSKFIQISLILCSFFGPGDVIIDGHQATKFHGNSRVNVLRIVSNVKYEKCTCLSQQKSSQWRIINWAWHQQAAVQYHIDVTPWDRIPQ